MKKFKLSSFLTSYGLLIIIWLLNLVVLYVAWEMKNVLLLTICFFMLFMPLLPGLPLMISYTHKRMLKRLPQDRAELERQGFKIEYEYTSRDTVYFINYSAGKMAVLFSMNPDEPQLIDPTLIQDIRTNDHRLYTGGTAFVACEFRLMGKLHRIATFMRTGRGTLSMKSREVLEGISKADQLCEMLRLTQQNAIAGKANR